MSQKEPDVPISGRVPAETKEELTKAAEDEGISRSAFVRELLEDGLDRYQREEPTRVETYLQRLQEFATAFVGFAFLLWGFTSLGEAIGWVTPAADAAAFTIGVVVIPSALVIILAAIIVNLLGLARTIGLQMESVSEALSGTDS